MPQFGHSAVTTTKNHDNHFCRESGLSQYYTEDRYSNSSPHAYTSIEASLQHGNYLNGPSHRPSAHLGPGYSPGARI